MGQSNVELGMDASISAEPGNPVLTAALGAAFLAWSGILVRLAATTPTTVAIYRCVYALQVLALLPSDAPVPTL